MSVLACPLESTFSNRPWFEAPSSLACITHETHSFFNNDDTIYFRVVTIIAEMLIKAYYVQRELI